MPVSARKLSANRRNAARSSGPRTVEGKMRSRHNAIRQGLFSVDVVLPGEDHEAYQELRRDAIDSLRPQDSLQLAIVERIAAANWRLRRLIETQRWLHDGRWVLLLDETLSEEMSPAEHEAARERLARLPAAVVTTLLLQDEDQAMERLVRHEQRLELSIQRSLRQLRELQDPKIIRPEESPFSEDGAEPAPPARWPTDEADDPPPQAICESEPTEARDSRNSGFTSDPLPIGASVGASVEPDPPDH